jgi:hypothetical protein
MQTRLKLLHYAAITNVCLTLTGLQASEIQPNAQLLEAIRNGNNVQVAALLDAGADPNAEDASATPFFMNAVLYGDARIVSLLLKHGAAPDSKNPAGAQLSSGLRATRKRLLCSCRTARIRASGRRSAGVPCTRRRPTTVPERQ